MEFFRKKKNNIQEEKFMKNVVVIGAGPAGLTAAYELLKKGNEYNVTLLEASADIGGISKTVVHNKNRMDIGGHRFFSKDEKVTAWWDEIMPVQGSPSYDDIKLGRKTNLVTGGPDPEKTDRVMLIRNRVSRIYYKKKFFDYPISMKPATFENMGFSSTVKAGCSYIKSSISKKEENSLENFYINRFGKVLYSMFFEAYTEKLWGRHPRDISADWGSQRVKGLSIFAIIKDMFTKLFKKNDSKNVETSLIDEFFYPKYGPGQLWEAVAADIREMGGKILVNSRVAGIEVGENNTIKSVVYNEGDEEKILEGDIFISSMPLKNLVAGMKNVPEALAQIADGLLYRDFTTVGLLLDKLNLVNETKLKTLGNITPDCWIYVQDAGVKLGRIQIFNNWSPYMVENPEKNIWVGLEYFCNEGDDFWNMSDDECVNYAVDELVRMDIISGKSAVLDSHRERVEKAYPAYFDTYKDIDKLIEYINKFENLYCVGRNGQHRYNNMDHSMATSFEAVENIVNGVKTKDNIWSVNTEKEYHEERKGQEK